jgi:hypothetical protein
MAAAERPGSGNHDCRSAVNDVRSRCQLRSGGRRARVGVLKCFDLESALARKLWKQAKKTAPFIEIRRKLREMATGLRRCMYCEDSSAVTIDHFWPIAVSPRRAFRWKNLPLRLLELQQPRRAETVPRFSIGNAARRSKPTRKFKAGAEPRRPPPEGAALAAPAVACSASSRSAAPSPLRPRSQVAPGRDVAGPLRPPGATRATGGLAAGPPGRQTFTIHADNQTGFDLKCRASGSSRPTAARPLRAQGAPVVDARGHGASRCDVAGRR